MADWRTLALNLTLADGKIDDSEVRVLRKALYADGKIDSEEVKFLVELRDMAQKKARAAKAEINSKFESFFFAALQANVLKNDKISRNETDWLKAMVFADGKVDANERKFLLKLKKAAKDRAPEFDAFVDAVAAEHSKKVAARQVSAAVKAPAAKKASAKKTAKKG